MRKFALWCGVVLLVAAPVRAEPTPAKLIKETWDAAYLEGAKTGYFHTTVHELNRDGQKIFQTTVAMSLTIKRYDAVVNLRMETGTDETPEGKVLGVSLTQFLDKGKVVQTGIVEDGQLVVRTQGKVQKLPWNNEVIGLYKQDRLFQEKKVKPGDRFHFLSYEPGLQMPVTVRVTIQDDEADVFAVKKDGDKTTVERVRKKMLRAEAVPDKVEINGNPVPLPKLVSWLDADRMAVRSEMDLPGLGKITLYRTTKEVAEKEGAAPALLPDLGLTTLIPLKRAIDRPHEAASAVYRITVKDDDDPASTFTHDARQEVKNVKDGTFELHVRAVREPEPMDKPGKPKDEFLKSSHFLDSEDETVQTLTRRAVQRETDPWRKARLIEKWVHDNMKPSSAIGFTTASAVARDLKGDCRQHAMLMAAMCRAAGVASRTALGVVYVQDRERGPVFGFHMWTEVWIDGQWLALDGTLGRGGIGVGHLKISEASWKDADNLAPLLPVTRVLGKMQIEVVSVR